jgi:hypothetical protein
MSHILFQRLNALYRLSVVQPAPVLHQLALMKRRPFEYHRRSTIREGALENRDRLDSDLSFAPGIIGMDMRRIVVVEIHSNHDAKEAADLGHLPISYHPPELE